MILGITLPASEHKFKLPSPVEMARFDAKTIAAGVPSLTLMDRAGAKIFESIMEISKEALRDNSTVVVLCGPGNNGGDGFVIARQLFERGIKVSVFCAGAGQYSAEFLAQAKRLSEEKIPVHVFPGATDRESGFCAAVAGKSELQAAIAVAAMVVDALLGTGQKEAPRGAVKEIIEAVNSVHPPLIVSVDIPSGVNGDSGEAFSPHISASYTVCIELIKRGMLQYPARDCCGEIHTVSIGIACADPVEFSIVSTDNIPRLQERRLASHKGNHGHVAVIGGNLNMPGAPALASLAALKAGAGLVTKAHLDGMSHEGLAPEVMLAMVAQEGGSFGQSSKLELADLVSKATCAVIGPGIGRHSDTGELLNEIIEHARSIGKPLVIDADALNLIAVSRAQGQKMSLPGCVITPHPGEAAALLGTTTAEIQRNRYIAAKRLADEFSCVAVLKGAATIVYSANNGVVNTTGNPFMATAGSGDVLAGVIAGIAAQGFTSRTLSLFESTVLGVYVHGLAGDIVHKSSGGPLIASDLAHAVPQALGEVGYAAKP